MKCWRSKKEGLTALRAIRETTRIVIGSWKQVCNEKTNQHIIIWTDSLSSLMAIRSINIRSKTVADSLTTVRNIATANTVELRLIAAHAGL